MLGATRRAESHHAGGIRRYRHYRRRRRNVSDDPPDIAAHRHRRDRAGPRVRRDVQAGREVRRTGATARRPATITICIRSRQPRSLGGLDLLPYWLLGVAGDGLGRGQYPAEARRGRSRAPKLITQREFHGAAELRLPLRRREARRLLRERRVAIGVTHVVDTVDSVALAEDGAIASVHAREHGELTADLYIDCTGFRAQLIGRRSACLTIVPRVLFCDSALAIQVPYQRPTTDCFLHDLDRARERAGPGTSVWMSGAASATCIPPRHTDATRRRAVLRGYLGAAGATARGPRDSASTRVTARPTGARTAWRSACRAASSSRSKRRASSCRSRRGSCSRICFPGAGTSRPRRDSSTRSC